MTEADSEMIKPEMLKAYIWLQTSDYSLQQVEQEVAMFCPFICQEIHLGMGSSKNHPISLPSQVTPSMFGLIFDYCRFHQAPGRSNKERKSFDEKLVRMNNKRLCELASAAYSLQLKPLVDLTSCALARIIEVKSLEEIREIFHLPDDLTQEEKLAPIENTIDDPTIRRLNILYAKKRKELQEIKSLKGAEVEEENGDDRSLDDLLSFINGDGKDSKGRRGTKNNKKKRKKKDQQKTSSQNCTNTSNSISSNNAESHENDTISSNKKVNDNLETAPKLMDIDGDRFTCEDEFDDCDLEDDIDPALKEQTDREVEEFARRLNHWRIPSLGNERRPTQYTINGNGSMSRLTSMEQHQK